MRLKPVVFSLGDASRRKLRRPLVATSYTQNIPKIYARSPAQAVSVSDHVSTTRAGLSLESLLRCYTRQLGALHWIVTERFRAIVAVRTNDHYNPKTAAP